MTSVNRFRLALVGLVFIVTAPVWAEEVAYDLDIEPQPLAKALKAFAEQSGLQVVYYSELADGEESPEVSGTMTADQAMTQLLASTDLTFDTMGEDTMVVETVAIGMADERGASDSKNLGTPTPVLMAQNQTSQAPTTSGRSEEGGTSIVTGKVTDARTGANLKGAKVMIEETGQWTSTNDLGEFRFVNVPTGSATLTVSFLGYAGQAAVIEARGDGTSQDFALRGGSEIEEIVVFGQRSARTQSLNQERTAPNSVTVLAGDFLGQFEGTTVSEALRRAPGIAFQEDSATGDGTNVIVRGLEPDLNSVTLNGLRIPETSGVGRAADLSSILTDSISQITINKTLLPSQSSSGTGGLIDIDTKSPLDRTRRFLSTSLEGGRRGGDFLDDYLASATASGIFGSRENIGLSASVQFRDRDIRKLSYDAFLGEYSYLPLDQSGSPILAPFLINPLAKYPFDDPAQSVFPTSVANRYSYASTKNLTFTLSGQWQVKNHTDLKFDLTRSEVERSVFQRSVQTNPFVVYELIPIEELGGEDRGALVWEDAAASLGLPGSFIVASQRYTLDDSDTETDVYSFRGKTKIDLWEVDYKLGMTSGQSETPLSGAFTVGQIDVLRPLSDAEISPDLATNVTSDGRIRNPYLPLGSSEGFPLPLLTDEGFGVYNDPSNYGIQTGFLGRGASGENERETVQLDLKRELRNDYLRFMQAGVFYESSEFKSIPFGAFNPLGTFFSVVPTLDDLGLSLSENPLSPIGLNGGFQTIADSAARSFLLNASTNSNLVFSPDDGALAGDSALLTDTFTEEEEFAAYIQARVDYKDFEAVFGVRYTEVDVQARNVVSPVLTDQFGVRLLDDEIRLSRVSDQFGIQTELLPRVALTYRYSDNLVFRAGYYLSIERPRISNISDDQTIRLDLQPIYGPNGDQARLEVLQGNPDLEPASTNNYDISVEYYDDKAGVIKLSAFYKDIKNLLETSFAAGLSDLGQVDLPDDPIFSGLNNDNTFVFGTKPVNSAFDATIWGIEAALERQFTDFPGAWNGLGIYVNYTYTDSEKEQFVDDFSQAGLPRRLGVGSFPFTQDPEKSGTAAFTYNKFGIDASIAYTFQDRRLNQYQPNNLLIFNERDDSLDLRIEYRFERSGAYWGIWFEGSDLLKSENEADVITSRGGFNSAPRLVTGGHFLGGRTFRLGFSSTL